MTHGVADLPWLPAAPADLSRRLKALTEEDAAPGLELQFLATHRESSAQAVVFRRTVRRLREAGADLSPLSSFRLAVVSNATVDFVIDHVPIAAARHGVAAEVWAPDFDQVMQEALNPASETNRHGADAILLAVDHRWLGIGQFQAQQSEQRIEAALERLFGAARAFKEFSGAALILPLLATPPAALFGSFERSADGSVARMIERVNAAILDYARAEGAYLLDIAALAGRIGADQWFEPVAWNAHKAPFAPRFNAVFADRVGALLGAIRGKARKCLVLDLDNTCWGGAIGDEGLEGIVLGAGSAGGEAFLSVQEAALELKKRGVILAVASKNNDEVARAVFRDHSEMLLRESDIAVFQANWTDKAANLEAIAETLNIGVDALVLLDDNPAERAYMRAALPAVAVPELPEDPAWFAWHLLSAGYFEATAFSEDDANRAASYADNARRAEVMAKARDTGDYLSSLKMQLSIRPFDAANRARITQLVNKTNQFNLTTNRYTEQQIVDFERDPGIITLQTRLKDDFGDMGMIGVVICTVTGSEAEISDWLMSCRVLGRKVEEGMFTALVEALRQRGVASVRATYRPTRKNNMVREHFDRLGFALVDEGEDGSRRYALDVGGVTLPQLPFDRFEVGGEVSEAD